MKVLLTGATGTLGRPLARALLAEGFEVRALSRRAQPGGDDIEWARGDLRTGEGVAEAVAGIEAIVHAATLSGIQNGEAKARYILFHPTHTDVGGAQRLVDAAAAAGVGHFLFTSVVGIEKVPLGYYKHKLAAEAIVEGSGVPYTIARATQFHELVDATVRYALKYPIPIMVRKQRVQPIDPSDVAPLVAGLLSRGPSDGIVNFGGPEEMTMGEAADVWLEDRGVRRRIRTLPLPGKAGRAMAAGALCTPDHSGRTTWREWLRAHPKEGS
jgi:uncharacterized protein YbjT (DUF2867 family)